MMEFPQTGSSPFLLLAQPDATKLIVTTKVIVASQYPIRFVANMTILTRAVSQAPYHHTRNDP